MAKATYAKNFRSFRAFRGQINSLRLSVFAFSKNCDAENIKRRDTETLRIYMDFKSRKRGRPEGPKSPQPRATPWECMEVGVFALKGQKQILCS